MRTTWNGSISFGLVSIPVGLAPATASSARQSDVSFKLLHRECLQPIRQKRWCPVHEIDLSPDEIVRGWEVAKGQFVPVEDAELEALESYDTSRSIEIKQFVPAGEVDPIYFDRTYYLVPAATEAQRRPYALLIEAMKEAAVVGLGSFVLAGKEKLCLIRPKGHALALETLFLAEDVRGQEEIDEPVEATGVKKQELALAKQIIAGLEGDFDPESLRSDYRARLRGLLEAKLEGHELTPPEPEEEVAPVVDLWRLFAPRWPRLAPSPRKRHRGASGKLSRNRSVLLRERVDRAEMGLEERLVDLALVDRDMLLDADPDHLRAVEADFLRKLLGRQMIGHVAPLSGAKESPPRSWRRRAGVSAGSLPTGTAYLPCPFRSLLIPKR